MNLKPGELSIEMEIAIAKNDPYQIWLNKHSGRTFTQIENEMRAKRSERNDMKTKPKSMHADWAMMREETNWDKTDGKAELRGRLDKIREGFDAAVEAPTTAARLGRKGGKAGTAAQNAARRANGALGGRPKTKQAKTGKPNTE